MAQAHKSKQSRPKRRTQSRAKLLQAAEQLFANHGFWDTTIESIAGEAGLHVQTLYRHFPTKADIALALVKQQLDEFRTYLANREGNTLSAYAAWVERSGRLNFSRFLEQGPTLHRDDSIATTVVDQASEYEMVLARGIAEDLNMNADIDLAPVMIACALLGGTRHAHEAWMRGGKNDPEAYVGSILRAVEVIAEQFPQLAAAPPRKPPAAT